MRAALRRFVIGVSGAAALEFALVATPLVMFTFGITEIGRALFMQQNLAYATDIAARMLYINPNTPVATLRAAVLDELFLGDSDHLTVTRNSGSAVSGTTRFMAIDLTVDYDFESVVPGIITDQFTMHHARKVIVHAP